MTFDNKAFKAGIKKFLDIVEDKNFNIAYARKFIHSEPAVIRYVDSFNGKLKMGFYPVLSGFVVGSTVFRTRAQALKAAREFKVFCIEIVND